MKTVTIDSGTHIQIWHFDGTDGVLIETRKK